MVFKTKDKAISKPINFSQIRATAVSQNNIRLPADSKAKQVNKIMFHFLENVYRWVGGAE